MIGTGCRRRKRDLNLKTPISCSQDPCFQQTSAQLRPVLDSSAFKQRFYPVTWARYDIAAPGSFRLLPTKTTHTRELELDYRDMQLMIFGQAPEFRQIMDQLGELEKQINT